MFCARHVRRTLKQVHVKLRLKSDKRRESLKAPDVGVKVTQC